jgi:hypothetical protein
MVVMLVIGAALFALGVVVVTVLVVRQSADADVTRREFDELYEKSSDVERSGFATREEAWRDFQAWRRENHGDLEAWPDDGAV